LRESLSMQVHRYHSGFRFCSGDCWQSTLICLGSPIFSEVLAPENASDSRKNRDVERYLIPSLKIQAWGIRRPDSGISALSGKGRMRFEDSQVPKGEAPGAPTRGRRTRFPRIWATRHEIRGFPGAQRRGTWGTHAWSANSVPPGPWLPARSELGRRTDHFVQRLKANPSTALFRGMNAPAPSENNRSCEAHGTCQTARRRRIESVQMQERRTAGAQARGHFAGFAARLKSCPFKT
jgi:hypothetical protein